ncbi:MAG: glycosyltransferase [Patescibacteria group bacterium]
MKIAIICSNLFNIDRKNRTGTGIFNYILINNLAKFKKKNCAITVFTSGASSLPVKVKSIDFQPSVFDQKIVKNGKHIMFELALISRAFLGQSKFDVFHVNIGDGDLVLPFSGFVRKPILVTLHHIINEDFTRKYFSIFKNNKNVFFVSVSNYQRKILPSLNYIETIYHGVDTKKFGFNPRGGKSIMWAGRIIPEKGPDVVIQLAQRTKHKAKLFGIIKYGFEDWYKQNIKNQIPSKKSDPLVSLHVGYERDRLIRYYQTSKLFLSPILLEESFGLVFIESMACGTPVVTFARGSAPEIIKDGQTGFLVNPSNDDIRGDWIIKKTGLAGLHEAVEKIFSMPAEEYSLMRRACREHVIHNFSAKKMAEKYLDVYKKIYS